MPLEANPAPPAPGTTLVGSRLLEEWVRAQSDRPTVVCARLSAECGLRGHQPAMGWYGTRPKRPTPAHWPIIERITGIVQSAWETWEKLGPDEPEPPQSGPRETDLPALGNTIDEIDASVRRAKSVIAKGGLSATQHAALERTILAGLSDLMALRMRGKIEDHVEYASLVEAVLDALDTVLREHGITPSTARMRFVDLYEANRVPANKRAA